MTDADPRHQVDVLRRKLDSGEQYVQYERDRDLLLRMSDHIFLVPSEIGDHRHLKLLRHNVRIATLAQPPKPSDFEDVPGETVYDEDEIEALLAENGLLGLALEERGAAQALVRWIHQEYSNEHTNQDYRTALRSFGRYLFQMDEPPESLEWIPTGTSNDFDPVPSERDLLLWESEVRPMIESVQNPRDAALIALQFEGGLRGGELYDLQVRDIFTAEHTTGVQVDGKRGERTVHLLVAIPWVQRWLTAHPGGPEDYLWSKLSTSERPSYSGFLDIFKRAASRIDVSKDATPTNFRKSNTRWLIIRGMDPSKIEDRQGRKRGSEHTARYNAKWGDESLEKSYAQLHGKDVEVEDDHDEAAPVPCPRCGKDTPGDGDWCIHCNQALDMDARDLVERVTELFDERAIEEDDPAVREDLVTARRTVESQPSMMERDELHELAASLDSST
ncbi:tyrosine-type recombinase/integrase [Salarchaeum sp. III]|uniref:tyrosine-type recombinase/integrase n=1 Tax=Salarchaeum sp. III TaxID=3107927 RepID=UPI002ED87D27